MDSADTVVVSVVGNIGIKPTYEAIECKKEIALATKEVMVSGGNLITGKLKEKGVRILPIDSEHSAIFQCLQGSGDRREVRRLILTASGGPFYGWSREQLREVTLSQALKHPNWAMGAKITVDSATLMNKGLEFIEAMRLYRMPPEKISIVVHRESIVHSLVEYCDNAVLAQLGAADMRLPIQYALTWPERTIGPARPLDLLHCPPLTFGMPDCEAFPCLAIAMEAARTGGTATAILNGANEAAVGLFLEERIGFMDIPALVERAMSVVPVVQAPQLEQIMAADRAARDAVRSTAK